MDEQEEDDDGEKRGREREKYDKRKGGVGTIERGEKNTTGRRKREKRAVGEMKDGEKEGADNELERGG